MGFEDILDNVFERDDTGIVVDEGFVGWLGKRSEVFLEIGPLTFPAYNTGYLLLRRKVKKTAKVRPYSMPVIVETGNVPTSTL